MQGISVGGKAPYETDLRPSIEAHCVPGAKSAVVVCPGGGYTMKAIDHEGAAFCRLFNDAATARISWITGCVPATMKRH